MHKLQFWVAFKKASPRCLSETAVEMITLSPFVHSEIRVGPHAYSAYQDLNPCFMKSKACTDQAQWRMIPIEITDEALAQKFLQDIVKAKPSYRFPWECVVPQGILKRVETDLNCCDPTTWGKVFCSQATLLFLRRCALANILKIPKIDLLFSVDSNGGSPAKLYWILKTMLQTQPVKNSQRKRYKLYYVATGRGGLHYTRCLSEGRGALHYTRCLSERPIPRTVAVVAP